MQTFIYDCTPHFLRYDYKFTGKERDAESGLDYFGARYYASNMGRFMSPDPSGLYFADPTNPQSLNLYSYALNNPLKNTDPTGMYCYYGDTGGGAQEDADLRDDSQFDYHSSQSECETADENGNKGQWINDAGTSQDANGNWVDNADRQPGYMEAATQPSSNQQSSQFDWSKLIPQATFQVGLSLNLGILGPITATGFTGFVFDTHGHVGTYRGGGGGASLGAGVSGGLQFGVSDGRSICAVGGPFVNASVTGGAGVAGTVDVFGGKGDGPGGVVVGDGGTIGIGGGADASVMVTGTTVKPFGNHQCSDGKIQ